MSASMTHRFKLKGFGWEFRIGVALADVVVVVMMLVQLNVRA